MMWGKVSAHQHLAISFEKEHAKRCTENRRGKAVTIQELARFLVVEADHRGVAKMLRRLWELKKKSTFASAGSKWTVTKNSGTQYALAISIRLTAE